MSRLPLRLALVVVGLAALAGSTAIPATAQTPAPPSAPGVFVQDGETWVELRVWGRRNGQRFDIGDARLEEIPIIADFRGALVRLGTSRLGVAFVGTADSFKDRGGELRRLPFFSRPLNSRATAIRIADLERPERVGDLLRQVGASDEHPGYVFLSIGDTGPDSRGVERGAPAGPELDMTTAGRPMGPGQVFVFRLSAPKTSQ